MTRVRFIPYMMTSSLRKILDAFSDEGITMLRGRRKSGECVEENKYSNVGLTLKERGNQEIIIDWKGSPVWGDRLISKIESGSPEHDVSVDEMRLRVDIDDEISGLMEGEWDRKDGGKFEIEGLSEDDHIYIEFGNKKSDFDVDDYNVMEDKTWSEHWVDINECDVCGQVLTEHGFKHSLFEVTSIESREVKETIPRSKRPIVDYQNSDIASWIHNEVLPQDLTSPNGMKKLKLDTQDEWIVESV